MIATLTKAQWRIVSMLAAGEVIDSASGRAPFVLRNEKQCVLPSAFRLLRRRGYLTLLRAPLPAPHLQQPSSPTWSYCLSRLGENRFESGEVAVR